MVMSFTGQSLVGPKDSFAILKLSDTAKDSPDRNADDIRPQPPDALRLWRSSLAKAAWWSRARLRCFRRRSLA